MKNIQEIKTTVGGYEILTVISLKDLSIDLESEYEKLCKQVAICKETIGGNEVGGLSVLPEYLWEHNYSRIIFGYELAKEQTGQVTAIPRGWDKTGIACPKDYNETYHLPQCLKLPNY